MKTNETIYENNETIDDVLICPMCNCTDCYEHGGADIEFKENGIGHYRFNCFCYICNKHFVFSMEFKYSITKTKRTTF